ncbi:pyridoxal-5'-phosphate-dependent enzyme subunit beta [Caballeronia terrestris]|uniref:L-serine ammonia-lyase n=1 Tax=Caballeronia terrestris TaxID=1226301 RepID=A0A158FU23_9BURK|nr:pyridoxal-phosphate dependent enzyme [Caballeronia terrestris]SAL23344.1 pyridoxal-5'-phosphate-dependent enzyme subunit beta [Caballeronia terrestris]
MYIETPLVESRALSERLGKSVWMKIEAMQPTGSFKARGIGHACAVYKERGARRFVSSSGGNAGLAVAYAGRKLGVPVLVVVPETTSERAKHLIGMEDAEVVVHGKSWDEANRFALASCTSADAFLHPFDDPLLWEGHATMIDEVARAGLEPDAVVLSVGGGGLLCGVAEGLRRNGWEDVPIVAVETEGADSYARSLAADERLELPAITSIATSLGARSVCAEALALAKRRPVASIVVSDRQAVAGCFELLTEHRIVVEPACGASVAALDALAHAQEAELRDARNILLIVCGGVGTSVDQLNRWRAATDPNTETA